MKRQNQQISRAYYETLDPANEAQVSDPLVEMRKAVLPLLAPAVRGRALCVGWSPAIRLTPPAADLFVVVDFSLRSLMGIPRRPNIVRICAEGAALPFDRGMFDTVVLLDIIHHLAEDDLAETDMQVAKATGDAVRVLGRNGTLLVFEPVLHPMAEAVERSLFLPMQFFMNQKSIPLSCMYSEESLVRLFEEAGAVLETSRRITLQEKLPISRFLPRWKLPPSFMPQKHTLLTFRKTG